MSKKIVAVDSQKLEAIQSCMYQYKLKFGSSGSPGSQPLVTPDYFERGGLLHVMLEAYYKMKRYKSRWQMNKHTHADIIDICVHTGRTFAGKMNLDIAEIETVIGTFMSYTEFWENDGWTNIESVERVGSKLLYDSSDLAILYEFKIDLILSGRQRLPVDHKSSKSRRDPNYLANQFKGYCFGLDCNTLIVNEICFQKTLPPKDKFRRHTLNYSDALLREWKEQTIWWIVNAISLIEKESYPMNLTSCDKYSGCIFKELCKSDPEVREYKFKTLFEDRTWDVGLEHL